jgi:CHAT domain-containing protein
VLNLLPFAALPLEHSDVPLDYSQLSYLQSGRELQLGYSARYLLELKERAVPEFTDNLLAFAPSFRGSATAIEVGEANRLRSLRSVIPEGGEEGSLPGLLPLQHNQSEVEAIATIVPGTRAYLSEAASRRAFLESIGKGRVVHISSHGLAHPQNPNLSFVAFSQDGSKLEEEELLYFNDLSTLPFQSELVVLSACETSLGKVVRGESILSLGAAFAAAGAQSTLTSLWKVDDAATEDLMVRFYEELAGGKTRSAALAMAQESQRAGQDFAHPYYWSVMALNGQSGALQLRSDFSFFRWGIIAGMIVLAGFFFWRRR